MALRDAVKSASGAALFAQGLYDFLHGRGAGERKFERWCEAVEALPRKQTRVLTWPLVTVFAFLAQPELTSSSSRTSLGSPRSNTVTTFVTCRGRRGRRTRLCSGSPNLSRKTPGMMPKDMIDIQSFIWVQGSI